MRAGGELAVLVHIAIDQKIDEIRSDAAIVQKRVALAWRSIADDLLSVVAKAGGNMTYDWMRYLVTRYEPSDGPQTQMVAFMRALFGERMLTNAMLKSTAISDAGITKQTLYEISRDQFTRSTYDRAVESLDSVNAEIEQLICGAWGR